MEFKENIYEHEFIADENSFDKKLRKLKIMYECNGDEAFLSLISLDNREARKYILSQITKIIPDLYLYDLTIPETKLRDYDKYIKTRPTAIFNFEDYIIRLSKENNISLEESAELIFWGINLVRDQVYLKYKTKSIMIFNDKDYYNFSIEADDFFDYCKYREDFNECFIDESGLTLKDYYTKEQFKKIKMLKK